MKIKIILLLNVLILNLSYTQNVPTDLNEKSIYSSISNPDVFSFERQSIKDVNYYTGKVSVSIPIYTIKSGNIEYPIILSYDSGGIKVDQLASDVGLGWSLSRSIITRTINQYNDFNNVGYNHLDNEYIQTTAEANKSFCIYPFGKANIGYFLKDKLNIGMDFLKLKVDFLPDIYNFYSADIKSKFFFKKINESLELNPTGLKIEAVKDKQLISTNFFINNYPSGNIPLFDFPTQDFFSIKVTTSKGIKYSFDDLDFSANYLESSIVNEYSYNCGYNNIYPAQVSAWNITKIEDVNSNKKISFEYDTTHSNPFVENLNLALTLKKTQKSINYTKIPYLNQEDGVIYQGGCQSYWVGESSQTNFTADVSARVDVQKKRIKRIIFDEGEVLFYYNNSNVSTSTISNIREDIYNGDFLSKIVVKNFKNEIIKTFEFKYEYFVSNYNLGEFNPDNEFNSYRYKRLKLTEVHEYGKNPYKFVYNEEIKLPPINSFSVDFLGYYNNSADCLNYAHLHAIKPSPKMYWYPNKEDKSLLPFAIPNNTNYLINGYFNREANEYSKAWSLKKIIYPSGGFSEFEYESNDFNIMGEDIKGGGIRIKKQILNDGYSNNNRYIEYIYKNSINKSSGILDRFPYYGHSIPKFFDVTYITDQGLNEEINPIISPIGQHGFKSNPWKIYGKSTVKEDVTSGSYVGYSTVIEKEIGTGRKEFNFTSNLIHEFKDKHYRVHPYDTAYEPNYVQINGQNQASAFTCLSSYLKANSGLGTHIYTDNSYKRGKLVSEKHYSENGFLLKSIINTYQNFEYQNISYYQPITFPWHVQSENNTGVLFVSKKKFKIANFLLVSKTETDFSNGISAISNNFNYNYNNKGFITEIKNYLSNNEVISKKLFYPDNLTTISSLPYGNITQNQLQAYQLLVQKNKIQQPIQEDIFRNSIKINSTRDLFKITNNNVFSNLIQISKSINNYFEDTISYNLIDSDSGNVLEVQQSNGIVTSLIWGYKKSLLIAKIENATYAQVQQYVANLQTLSNGTDENAFSTALNNLRSALPNAMVSTYTHKPLIGLSTATDPKGDKQTYHYDSFNRLQFVKDKEGNILSENEYHYKN